MAKYSYLGDYIITDYYDNGVNVYDTDGNQLQNLDTWDTPIADLDENSDGMLVVIDT